MFLTLLRLWNKKLNIRTPSTGGVQGYTSQILMGKFEGGI
jgi:hypothetical protein